MSRFNARASFFFDGNIHVVLWPKTRYHTIHMVQFNEEGQEKRVAKLRQKEEESLIRLLSGKYGIPYVDLAGTPINNKAIGVISEDDARGGLLGAFRLNKKTLSVAIFSPNNARTRSVLEDLEQRGYVLELYMTTRAQLEKIWDRYKDISFSQKTEAGVLDISKATLSDIVDHVKTMRDIKTLLDNLISTKEAHRVSKVLKMVVAGAYALDASDVHLEAQEEQARVRYRLDGVLQDVTFIDPRTYRLLLARIKLLSGLKLNIESHTQDGRFSVKFDALELQVRTSLLPGSFGENVVLRVLNPESITLPLEELGLEPGLLEVMSREIKKPNGMILTTGPTGSGKTTTLYAFLRTIYDPEVKIITIEDPVEYHLPGISQTQADKNSNYTFLNGLRAALRQDPDIIMIGEIRDSETARIAVNASLTGHLVFSTLHTNNAGGAIPRLIDLGVNPKVIGSALLVSMAQRLVRRLCAECKKQYTASERERRIIEEAAKDIKKKKGEAPRWDGVLWKSPGCALCNNTGYKGRIGLYEAILTDENVERLITENPSERELFRAAEKQGILSMKEDGIMKMIEGITSFAELERVVDVEGVFDKKMRHTSL